MTHSRYWKWEAAGGYTIDRESGTLRKQEGTACTLHFYLAEQGDMLHLLSEDYEYAVATYGLEVDPKYIYTYDYQPEQNWTEYRHDFFEDKFTQGDYVFSDKCCFRVIIRRKYEQGRIETAAAGTAATVGTRVETAIAGEAATERTVIETAIRAEKPAAERESEDFDDLRRILQWKTQMPETEISKKPVKDAGYSRLPKKAAAIGESGLTDQAVTIGGQGPTEQVGAKRKNGPMKRAESVEQARAADGLDEAIDAVVWGVCSNVTEDSLQFLLMSDSHYTVNGTWEDTVSNLHQVTDRLTEKGVRLEGFLHLGDMTDGLVPAEVTRDYVHAVQEDIRGLGLPLYYVPGNHDSNYFRKNPERFSEAEMRELYLPEQDKCYYYKDFPEQRLRIIFLESFDPSEQVRYGFPDEELDWLEMALKQLPSDWYVLVCSHVPPTPRLHYWSKEIRGSRRLIQILRDFQTSGRRSPESGNAEPRNPETGNAEPRNPETGNLEAGNSELRNSETGNLGAGNPEAGKVKIDKVENEERACTLLGFIHGHNHADQIDYEEGFPIISIGCNKCEYFEDKKPEGAITYKRALHTVSQDLWDVLVISVKNQTLDFIRFGAGENRHISLKECRSRKRINGKQQYGMRQSEKPQNEKPRSEELQSGRPWSGGLRNGELLNGLPDRNGREESAMKKVITYGTFDLFHEGHYNILKRAKALGDYLIVGVTTEYYDEQRGKLNIVDSLLERIENVRHTGLVDEIIIEDHEGQKIEDVQKYGVDIFTLGSDWKGVFDYLKPYCQVVYLERTPDISSTMLRRGKYPIIRMGVVGTGRIAPRFLSEAKYVSGLNVQCAYNPHRESVEKFASEYYLEGYCESYEEFLKAVDAVYIAAPHETHYDYTERALQAGKHVLCEKPLAFTREQAQALFALAREKELVLMEGIKTAYCPGFAQLISIAKSGRIGEIRDVEACFSRLTPPHLREMADVRYGGAFLEFGSYTVLPVLKLLGLEYENVRISSIKAENGVDLYTKVYFDYPEGMATSKTGLGVKSEGQLLISGTKGYILAESPWWLTRKFQVRYEDPNRIETYNPNFLGDGLRYEIGEFASRINGRSGHAFKLTEEESVAMADVVERFLKERRRQRTLSCKAALTGGMKIWAHRGASYQYPENTLIAFQTACRLPGLAGIELDIQLSRDGEIVVFHDETLDRLMDRTGNVRDYTLAELQKMQFKDWIRMGGVPTEGAGFADESERLAGGGEGLASGGERLAGGAGNPAGGIGSLTEEAGYLPPRIPSMREVLELVRPYALSRGVQINIELKNSRIRYEGMEEKILSLVSEYGMEDYIVYSSFNGASIRHLKELDGSVRTGILQSDIRNCLRLIPETLADALHPNEGSMTEEKGWSRIEAQKLRPDMAVRAWNNREPFYGQDRQYVVFDLERLGQRGITEFITNVPEEYLVFEKTEV